MLTTIPLLTCYIFGVLYPLCFWISYRDPLKDNFHHFHLGVAVVVGALAVVGCFMQDLSVGARVISVIWIVNLAGACAYYWRKDYPQAIVVTFPCLVGLAGYWMVQGEMVAYDWQYTVMGVLSGLILCIALFAMNLGHWYLNVHGLPVSHLMRSVYLFWILVGLRFVWDGYQLIFSAHLYQGDVIPVFRFMGTIDGFFLNIGLFFGVLLPLVVLHFVRGTLLVKSTQSATGILYVILCSVLIGDMTYKYYLIKYGLVL